MYLLPKYHPAATQMLSDSIERLQFISKILPIRKVSLLTTFTKPL